MGGKSTQDAAKRLALRFRQKEVHTFHYVRAKTSVSFEGKFYAREMV